MAVAPGTRLFGTDGVRGPAGEFLSAELAFSLGRAAAAVCDTPSPQVLVVRDTRVSGEMLEAALCAGIAAAGGQALLAGVLPTPAASILVRRYGFDMGAVISASHNPYHDNGIKFFDARGRKLSDEAEAAVEAQRACRRRACARRRRHDLRARARADRRGRRLPAGARDALRAVARGPAGAARLRERRDVQGRAAAVRAARRGGRMPRVRARRRQHQRRLRLHAHGADRRAHPRGRSRPRLRVRRRRRSRAGGRARRQRRRRRRDHRRDRAAT